MNKFEVELIENTKKLVKQEKELTLQILKNLDQIESRKLFVEFGFSSLHSYCVEVLGYAPSEALLKLSAMRLMREFTDLDEKLETGKLSLTVVGEVQMNIVKKERELGKKISHAVKADLLKKVEGQSTRAAAKIVKEELVIEDKLKAADFKLTEVTVNKLKKLGDKLDVKNLDQLIQMLVKEKEERLIEEKQSSQVTSALKSERVNLSTAKAVPVKLRRAVFIRSNYQCELCKSKKYLNVDHIYPRALGGVHSLANMRVLCSACNQRERVKVFGIHTK